MVVLNSRSNVVFVNVDKQFMRNPGDSFASRCLVRDVVEMVGGAVHKLEDTTQGGCHFDVRTRTRRSSYRDFFVVTVRSSRELSAKEVNWAFKNIVNHFERDVPGARLSLNHPGGKSKSGEYELFIDIDFNGRFETLNTVLNFWNKTPKLHESGHCESTQDLYSSYCTFTSEMRAMSSRPANLASKDDFVQVLKNLGLYACEKYVWHLIVGSPGPTESQS